jgi:hypothetical protein
MKKCAKCKQEKEATDFTKWSSSYCRSCRNEYSRNYMKTTHRLNARRAHLRSTFGLTIEDWNGMFKKQEGKCLICSRHISELNQPMCVDHDHENNKIRGLLCKDCNSGLGLFHDNPYALYRAFKHLEYKLPTSVAQLNTENLCRTSQKCEEEVDKKPLR